LDNYLDTDFRFDSKIIEFVNKCSKEIEKDFENLNIVEEYNQLKEKLVNLGYQRADLIEARGQFSVRGDIIDISFNDKEGIRIEFWGDNVDSIRRFDIKTQRSIETLTSTEIYPATENILEIENAIKEAKRSEKPVLIEIRTVIGKYSLLQGTHKVHGAPLSIEDIEQLKEKLELRNQEFLVSKETIEEFQKEVDERNQFVYENWLKKVKDMI